MCADSVERELKKRDVALGDSVQGSYCSFSCCHWRTPRKLTCCHCCLFVHCHSILAFCPKTLEHFIQGVECKVHGIFRKMVLQLYPRQLWLFLLHVRVKWKKNTSLRTEGVQLWNLFSSTQRLQFVDHSPNSMPLPSLPDLFFILVTRLKTGKWLKIFMWLFENSDRVDSTLPKKSVEVGIVAVGLWCWRERQQKSFWCQTELHVGMMSERH